MDVLADASIAASNHESDAAAILRKLYEHRGGLGQFEEEAADAPLSSPVSEETVDLHATPHPWAQNEDDLLRRLAAARAVATSSGKRMLGDMSTMLSDNSMIWEDIANQLGGRTAAQCASRYQKVLNPENVKGPWCPSEDAQLIELVGQYGGKHWARIASMLPGRTGKQCRERWCNNLDPSLKKGAWTAEEDQIILKMHAKLGTRWAEIAKSLPGRSDNSVKNRWYSTCSRVLRQQQEAESGGDALEDVAQVVMEASRSQSGESADMESADGLQNKRPRNSSSTPPSRSASPRDLVSPRERKLKLAPSATPPQKEREALSRRPDLASSLINIPVSWSRLVVNLPKVC